MTSVAIIPARGGSRRIPDKNIRDFFGQPIIAYSIQAARKTKLFERILVSTDSRKVAEVAKGFDADVLWRPPDLSQDHVGTYAVMGEAAQSLDLDWGQDLVCCIYATAPMIRETDIGLGRAELHRGIHAISVGVDPLRDAAQFYWSRVFALRTNIPYWAPGTVPIPVPEDRICDINTFADWEQALRMYERLHDGDDYERRSPAATGQP